MALPDPLSITIDGTATSLPRIGNDAKGTTLYQSSDGKIRQKILQATTKSRKRSSIRIETTDLVTDALTGLTRWEDLAVYIMMDRPASGIPNDRIIKVLTGLVASTSATSYSLASRVLGGES